MKVYHQEGGISEAIYSRGERADGNQEGQKLQE